MSSLSDYVTLRKCHWWHFWWWSTSWNSTWLHALSKSVSGAKDRFLVISTLLSLWDASLAFLPRALWANRGLFMVVFTSSRIWTPLREAHGLHQGKANMKDECKYEIWNMNYLWAGVILRMCNRWSDQSAITRYQSTKLWSPEPIRGLRVLLKISFCICKSRSKKETNMNLSTTKGPKVDCSAIEDTHKIDTLLSVSAKYL